MEWGWLWTTRTTFRGLENSADYRLTAGRKLQGTWNFVSVRFHTRVIDVYLTRGNLRSPLWLSTISSVVCTDVCVSVCVC